MTDVVCSLTCSARDASKGTGPNASMNGLLTVRFKLATFLHRARASERSHDTPENSSYPGPNENNVINKTCFLRS